MTFTPTQIIAIVSAVYLIFVFGMVNTKYALQAVVWKVFPFCLACLLMLSAFKSI